MLRVSLVLLLLAACSTVSTREMMPPELAFVNGTIYTLDPARPKAQAIAVRGGRIVEVGSNADIAKLGAARTVDLGGKTVVPGFVDAHCHIASLGYELQNVKLSDVRSYDQMVQRTRERLKTARPGEWIHGSGWNQENWGMTEYPTHHKLSEATPNNPVIYRRKDGHAVLVNKKALDLAKITRDTKNPPGGEILKGSDGEPTGILVDNAIDLIDPVVPDPTLEQIKDRILLAQEACLEVGQTELQDASVGEPALRAFSELAAEGKLKVRCYLMINGGEQWVLNYIRKNPPRVGVGAQKLTVRAIKMFIDGSLGSRSAWMLAPFEDRPVDDHGKPYTGLPVIDPESVRRVGIDALKYGWQLNVHACGDRGAREVLNQFEAALREVPVPDHRFRMEHAQLVQPEDIARFPKLGVIPSMQPTHGPSDMHMVDRRIDVKRRAGAYAWRKFLEVGCRIAGGSDFPVESYSPLAGFYAAVTRQDDGGKPEGGWRPEDKMTREEALRCFTIDACFASFEESWKGTLEAGKAADFVVLSNDIMTCSPREILNTQVLHTIINGEILK